MPLTKDNYENFYLGNGAEHRIISELFLHGFEGHKFNPDIGIDILVTNKAFSQFHESNEAVHYLQVKATFLIDGEARFYIKESELEYLKSEDRLASIFCYFRPIIEAEPKNFDRGDFEPWWESEEASFMRHLYETEFRELRKMGCLSQLDFKGFDMGYIWLNNAQLIRAIEERFIQPGQGEFWKLVLKSDEDDALVISGPDSDEVPVSEIENLYYMLKESKSSDRFAKGDFLVSHY